jgi:RNA polymerase sigma factor (sigma-70 family)
VDHTPEPVSDSLLNELEREVAAAWQEYSPELLRYAASWTRSEQEAQDALQEVFLRYFVERTYGRRIENPRGWLYQVLRNHLMDRARTAAATREVPSDDLEWVPDNSRDPERKVQRSQLAAAVAAAVTDRELACLRLRSEGLCYEEIANRLGVRPGTVGALLSRVHRKLRPSVAGDGGGEEPLDLAEAIHYLFRGVQTHSS